MTSADYTPPLSKSKPRARGMLVQGVGINDYPASVYANGKPIRAYSLWRDMLFRCYSAKAQKKDPTYTGCSTSEDWHLFSKFEEWVAVNYVEGYELDKDILFSGNRVYSADTCIFVPKTLNTLLLDSRAIRGECPLGVHFHKDNQKYVAQISTEKGRLYLGSFPTPLEAHKAWQLAKADIIANFPTTDPRIRTALDKRVAQLRDDYANNRITVKL